MFQNTLLSDLSASCLNTTMEGVSLYFGSSLTDYLHTITDFHILLRKHSHNLIYRPLIWHFNTYNFNVQ